MKSRLRRAARMWGIQTEYRNVDGVFVKAPEASLLASLRLVSGQNDEDLNLSQLIFTAKKNLLTRGLQPVNVALAESVFSLQVYLPDDLSPRSCDLNLINEETRHSVIADFKYVKQRQLTFEGQGYSRYQLTVLAKLPVGYYTLKISSGHWSRETRIFSAPEMINFRKARSWGGFAPLYALRSESDWGIGSTSELHETRKIIKENGGEFLGILPLLPTDYSGDDVDPSPYSPISRLFWNEIYLDIGQIEGAPEAFAKYPSSSQRLNQLKSTPLVDYKNVYRIKKEILHDLAREYFVRFPQGDRSFNEFLQSRPEVKEYAKFRAGDSKAEYQYHLFVQYQMEKILKQQTKEAQAGEIADLYLDFPVGVDRAGFDSQFYASNFVLEASVGAPPDLMFSKGQNWGFAPFHPHRIREDGYSYFIKCLRHHLNHAGLLRIDHAMGFYRIYIIPQGFDAKSGVYLRFHQKEFLAILRIEASLNNVKIVGEDLGTVPDMVRKGLTESGCLRMWVWPFEAGVRPQVAAKNALSQSLSCLNTHDMIPFEGFLKGRDLEIFEELALMNSKERAKAWHERQNLVKAWMKTFKVKDSSELLIEILRLMSLSPPVLLLVNLEDLWQETEPQNVPGTWKEYPNWQKKFRYSLEEWADKPEIKKIFSQLSEWRRVV